LLIEVGDMIVGLVVVQYDLAKEKLTSVAKKY